LIVIAAGDDGSRHDSVGGRRLLSVAEIAGEDGSRHKNAGEEDGGSGCHDHGGGGTVATRAGGEVLDLSSSDSSDDEVLSVQSSVQNSVQSYGNGVLCDSPLDFAGHNDHMVDSPTDNEVSKYSFYARLTHYMEGQKICEANRAAVEICILSEAGAFVRNMDPMKKDRKEGAFFAKYLSIIDEIEDDQFEDRGLSR
jgi:hypothetical protein